MNKFTKEWYEGKKPKTKARLTVWDYLRALDKTMVVVPLFFIFACFLTSMLLNDGIIIININSVWEGWLETAILGYAFFKSIVLLNKVK